MARGRAGLAGELVATVGAGPEWTGLGAPHGDRAVRRPAVDAPAVQIEVASADQDDLPRDRADRTGAPVTPVTPDEPHGLGRTGGEAHQLVRPIGPIAPDGEPGLPRVHSIIVHQFE